MSNGSMRCVSLLRKQAKELRRLAKQVKELNITPAELAYDLWPVIKALVDEGTLCRLMVDDM